VPEADEAFRVAFEEAGQRIGVAFTPAIRDVENAISDIILGAPHASAAIRDFTNAIAAQALIDHPKGPFQDQMNSLADGWTALIKVIRPGIDEENQWIAANKSLGDSIGATNGDMMLFFATLKYNGGKTVPEITQAFKALVAVQNAAGAASTVYARRYGASAVFVAAAMDIAVNGMGGSLRRMSHAWTQTIGDINSGWTRGQRHLISEAVQLPVSIASGIKSNESAVKGAMAALRYDIEHPMDEAHYKAFLLAKLTSKNVRDGLKSHNPQIRAETQALVTYVKEKLQELSGIVVGINGSIDVTVGRGITPGVGRKNRGFGGPVGGLFGNVFTVGENGPETLFMGQSQGFVMPTTTHSTFSGTGNATMHHEGTVRLEMSASTLEAMHQAGYSGREVGEAARAASGFSEVLSAASRTAHLASTSPRRY